MKRRTLIKNTGAIISSGLLAKVAGVKSLEENSKLNSNKIHDDWLIVGSAYVTEVQEKASQVVLSNGLISRVFKIQPDCATIGLNNLMTGEGVLRAVSPEAEIQLNGEKYAIGGLTGQPVQNYLSVGDIKKLKRNPKAFHYVKHEVGKTKERFPWKRNSVWSSRDLPWPPPGKRITFYYEAPKNIPEEIQAVKVAVVYEMYDGIPAMSKWIEIENTGKQNVRLNRFKAEILSVVEEAPKIADGTPREYRIYGREEKNPPHGLQLDAPRDYVDGFMQMFAVTDYAMGGDMEAMKDNPGVHWIHDPDYEKTGIRYYGQYQPALLECKPPYDLGPDIDLFPNKKWESFHVFELLRDSSDKERRGLAERKFWRVITPWSQENPLFMHVREADTASVKKTIDQCAEVGFQLVIMTFGSGFNIENKDQEYLKEMKELADYAQSKNIAIGGYSLLASRGGSDEIVDTTPKMCVWGNRYKSKKCLEKSYIYKFINQNNN